MAEIAKLSASNLAEEGGIKKAYVELGKLYYAEHGATPDAGYAAACEKIAAAKATIEANNERIARLKAEAKADGVIDADEVEEAVEAGIVAEQAAEAEGERPCRRGSQARGIRKRQTEASLAAPPSVILQRLIKRDQAFHSPWRLQ